MWACVRVRVTADAPAVTRVWVTAGLVVAASGAGDAGARVTANVRPTAGR